MLNIQEKKKKKANTEHSIQHEIKKYNRTKKAVKVSDNAQPYLFY